MLPRKLSRNTVLPPQQQCCTSGGAADLHFDHSLFSLTFRFIVYPDSSISAVLGIVHICPHTHSLSFPICRRVFDPATGLVMMSGWLRSLAVATQVPPSSRAIEWSSTQILSRPLLLFLLIPFITTSQLLSSLISIQMAPLDTLKKPFHVAVCGKYLSPAPQTPHPRPL